MKEVLATAMSMNMVDTSTKSGKSELLFSWRTLLGVNHHLFTYLVWKGVQGVHAFLYVSLFRLCFTATFISDKGVKTIF